MPLAIDVRAASSSTVDVKFCPLPPTFENRATGVPLGAISIGTEVRIVRIRDIKTDRDVGNRECAVVIRYSQTSGSAFPEPLSSPWELSD